MLFTANKFLSNSLDNRLNQNAFRKLVLNNKLIDFCSNDYLGFARSNIILDLTALEFSSYNFQLPILNGSTGSRLLTGNSDYVEFLEKKIATFHNAPAGLIFNSGYDANLGLISAIAQKGDTIIYDELIHASIHDGIRLSSSSAFKFRHNNIVHLEERLKIASGVIYVIVESVYSMDGDVSPILAIVDLCKKYHANLIIDEAHATGITVNMGKGMVQQLKIEQDVFARIHTFSKALGGHGAIVLGSELLRNFLINFSRSFIYTTALPLKSLIAVNQAYELLQNSKDIILKLHENIAIFKNHLSENVKFNLIQSDSPIQCIIVKGNDNVKFLAAAIQNEGYDIRPVLSPTVLKGRERLRICIHVFNTASQIQNLCAFLNTNF